MHPSKAQRRKISRCVELAASRGYGLAYSLVGTRPDAEDLVQNALTIALRKIDEVPNQPWPWFAKTIAFEARNLRRSRSRRSDTHSLDAGGLEVEVDSDAAEMVLQEEMRERVWEAFRALPQEEREVLALTVVAGLSARQAAKEMGISASTLRRRRADGLASLERSLGIETRSLLAILPILALPQASFVAKLGSQVSADATPLAALPSLALVGLWLLLLLAGGSAISFGVGFFGSDNAIDLSAQNPPKTSVADPVETISAPPTVVARPEAEAEFPAYVEFEGQSVELGTSLLEEASTSTRFHLYPDFPAVEELTQQSWPARFRVELLTGELVPGVRVELSVFDSENQELKRGIVYSESDGITTKASFVSHAECSYVVAAVNLDESNGKKREVGRLQLSLTEVQSNEVYPLVVNPPLVIRGCMIDENLLPLERAYIGFAPPAIRSFTRNTTRPGAYPDGRFVAISTGRRSFNLYFHAGRIGKNPLVATLCLNATNLTILELGDVMLRPGVAVRGAVTLDGKPFETSVVFRNLPEGTHRANCDKAGKFELDYWSLPLLEGEGTPVEVAVQTFEHSSSWVSVVESALNGKEVRIALSSVPNGKITFSEQELEPFMGDGQVPNAMVSRLLEGEVVSNSRTVLEAPWELSLPPGEYAIVLLSTNKRGGTTHINHERTYWGRVRIGSGESRPFTIPQRTTTRVFFRTGTLPKTGKLSYRLRPLADAQSNYEPLVRQAGIDLVGFPLVDQAYDLELTLSNAAGESVLRTKRFESFNADVQAVHDIRDLFKELVEALAVK